MKKKILGLGMAFALCLSANTANAQALEEGNMLFDIYTGGPNLTLP